MDTPQLPTNTTAEIAILACIMQDSSFYFLDEIKGDWFYSQGNRDIFAFLQESIFTKKEVNHVSFDAKFGGLYDFYEIVGNMIVLPSQDTFSNFVQDIKAAYDYRQLIQVAQRIYSLGYSRGDMDVIKTEIQKLVDVDVISKTEYLLSGAIEALGDTLTPKFVCETGYTDLDEIISGFRCGGLVVMGARPGSGKSTLALNLVDNCLQQGVKCAFFSTEMTAREIQERFLCMKSGISMPLIDKREQETIDRVLTNISTVSYEHDCAVYDRVTSVENMVAGIHRECLQGARIIVVDYIQQIPIDTRRGTRAEMLGLVSTKLKQLAKQYSACIICCAQLNREVEKRVNKRPLKSDLKDSGSLEQDADVVLLLEAHEENESLLNIYIEKNRQGGSNVMIQLKRERRFFILKNT